MLSWSIGLSGVWLTCLQTGQAKRSFMGPPNIHQATYSLRTTPHSFTLHTYTLPGSRGILAANQTVTLCTPISSLSVDNCQRRSRGLLPTLGLDVGADMKIAVHLFIILSNSSKYTVCQKKPGTHNMPLTSRKCGLTLIFFSLSYSCMNCRKRWY